MNKALRQLHVIEIDYFGVAAWKWRRSGCHERIGSMGDTLGFLLYLHQRPIKTHKRSVLVFFYF